MEVKGNTPKDMAEKLNEWNNEAAKNIDLKTRTRFGLYFPVCPKSKKK
jgi:hypothetical protein